MIKNILISIKKYAPISLLILLISLVSFVIIYSKNSDNIIIYPEDDLFSEKYSQNLENKDNYVTGESINLKRNPLSDAIFLDFNFMQENNSGVQNIFQTDDYNSGIRLEISNNVLSLITAHDEKAYKIFVFKTKVYNNKTYNFKIHAIDSYGFYAQLNDEQIKYHSYNFNFNLTKGLLGNGFDNNRKFLGTINNVHYSSENFTVNDKLFIVSLFAKKYFSEIVTFFVWIIPLISFIVFFILYGLQKKYSAFIKNFNYFNKLRLYIIENYNFDIQNLLLFIIITLVLLILIFVPVYLYFTLTYISLFLTGIGFYITLLPKYARDDNFALCIVPIFGLIATTILGGYLITLNTDIKYLIYILPIYSVLLLFFTSARTRYLNIIISVKSKISTHYGIYFFIPLIVIFFLLFPNIIYPETSFYRIGPDLSLYAKMSQYVFDGALLSESQQRLSEFSGMPVGDINKLSDATATWPFMYFFRWGFASVQSLMLLVTPASHVFQISFLSLVFSHLALGFVVFYWLYKAFNISRFISLLAALSIIFNSNILNLWYEGFYANSYSLYIYLFLIFLFFWRNNIGTSHKKYDLIPIYTFLLIAILLTYPEGLIFIFVPLTILSLVFEILIYKKINFSIYSTLAISFVFAFILLLPSNYLIDWISLTIKQLSEEGGNGFMQPHWALPHEILGIYNIYMNILPSNAGVRFERSLVNYVLSFSLTILILLPVLYYIKNNFKKITPVLYSSYILVGIIAIFVFTFSRENNYLYMKYYIFMTPILLITFWLAIDFYQKKINITEGGKKYFIYILITSVITMNGLSYIGKYTLYAQKISQNKLELYNETKNIDFNNTIFYPYSYNGVLYSYASLINVPWMIKDKYELKYYKKYLNYKVCVFLKASDFKDNIANKEIVFRNKDYVIIDSGFKLSDFIGNNIAKEGIFTNFK